MSWCFVPRCWVNALALRSIAFQLGECRPGEVRSISDLQPSPSCRKLEPSNESNTSHTIAPSHLDSLHQRRQNIHDLKHLQHGQEMPRAQNDRRMKVLHIQNVNSKKHLSFQSSVYKDVYILYVWYAYKYIFIYCRLAYSLSYWCREREREKLFRFKSYYRYTMYRNDNAMYAFRVTPLILLVNDLHFPTGARRQIPPWPRHTIPAGNYKNETGQKVMLPEINPLQNGLATSDSE